jgi:hypothetical protein
MPANGYTNGGHRVYSGVDAIKAADVVRRDASNREKWPYMHVHPPVNAEPVHAIGTIATPALADQVVVLAYQVPKGFRFYLRGIIQSYEGGAYGVGKALWTVDRNTPVGVANIQAQPEQGLVAIPVQLGSFVPFKIDEFYRSYEFEPLDIVRSKATNVGLGVGDPNYFTTGFFGYLVPDVDKR